MTGFVFHSSKAEGAYMLTGLRKATNHHDPSPKPPPSFSVCMANSKTGRPPANVAYPFSLLPSVTLRRLAYFHTLCGCVGALRYRCIDFGQ